MHLAQIVAQANIKSLSLLGLAKNVGKTTTTSHLLATLLANGFYQPQELALTSLGLDGEMLDTLTGLPKPRYRPQAGLLIVTTDSLLAQAEKEGARFQRLRALPGRTALGSVWLARVLQSGYVAVAGPTLLRDVRQTLALLPDVGARLALIDGAINRLGAAAPSLTDACILCTGASAASSVELVAKRTAEIIKRFNIPQTNQPFIYQRSHFRFSRAIRELDNTAENYTGPEDPASEARWLVQRTLDYRHSVFLLRKAFTEELARELLRLLIPHQAFHETELIVEDATKIFCHTSLLQQLADKGLSIHVAVSVRILAITVNPYAPEYTCTTQELLTTLHKVLPACSLPLLDVKIEKY